MFKGLFVARNCFGPKIPKIGSFNCFYREYKSRFGTVC